MTVQELIDELERLKALHGEQEVKFWEGDGAYWGKVNKATMIMPGTYRHEKETFIALEE